MPRATVLINGVVHGFSGEAAQAVRGLQDELREANKKIKQLSALEELAHELDSNQDKHAEQLDRIENTLNKVYALLPP